MVSIYCNSCGKLLNIPEELSGKRVRCPGCRQAFLVEYPPPIQNEPQPVVDEPPPITDEPPPVQCVPVPVPAEPAPAEPGPVLQEPQQEDYRPPASSSSDTRYRPGYASRDFSRYANKTDGQEVVRAAIVGAVVGTIAMVVLGVLVSQYWPMFGGLVSLIGEPFSPARLHYLPVHCIVFGICGAVLGAIVFGAHRYLKL